MRTTPTQPTTRAQHRERESLSLSLSDHMHATVTATMHTPWTAPTAASSAYRSYHHASMLTSTPARHRRHENKLHTTPARATRDSPQVHPTIDTEIARATEAERPDAQHAPSRAVSACLSASDTDATQLSHIPAPSVGVVLMRHSKREPRAITPSVDRPRGGGKGSMGHRRSVNAQTKTSSVKAEPEAVSSSSSSCEMSTVVPASCSSRRKLIAPCTSSRVISARGECSDSPSRA